MKNINWQEIKKYLCSGTVFILLTYGDGLKKILLTKVAKVSEYTAEQGDGWPTYWGFHEIIPDSDIKTILAKKKNEKKNDK